MKTTLFVGDTVLWRGGFGKDPPRAAVVTELERVTPGAKDGDPCRSMLWSEVGTYAVVTLSNGHWAYGSQLSPF